MMATIVATGLKIEGENHTHPMTRDEWITLAIRLRDNAVLSVRGPIRVPTVIVAVKWLGVLEVTVLGSVVSVMVKSPFLSFQAAPIAA